MTLEQKIEELKAKAEAAGKALVFVPFVNFDHAFALANKASKKIAVLVGNEKETLMNAYSVDLENWLDAESKGINSDEIMSGLSVLRAFGSRSGQRYISKGDIFQEIKVEELAVHLDITS